MSTDKAGFATLLRAGREVLGAFAARTGPRQRSARRFVLPVALVAAAGIGAAAGGAAMADNIPVADRARIEAVVRDYILAHPEIIPEAMDRLRSKESAKAVNDNRKDIETPYSGAWEGATDGDVVLTEFFDYACGYCRTAAPDVARLVAEDKGLKIVYRELPILGDESVTAARVGLLAADSGHYPAFHRAMYQGEGTDKAAILAAAGKAGLDRGKVLGVLGSRGTADEFAKNIALAQALNARGTPLFVVGDEVLHGAVGYEEMKAAIARTRAAKTQNSNKNG